MLLSPQFQTELIVVFLLDLQIIRIGQLLEDIENSFLRHVELIGQLRRLKAFIKGVEDCGEAFCLDGEVCLAAALWGQR